MGFLGLIPADHLAASYESGKQLLTLYADGNVQKFTSGIRFFRDLDFVGGLRFFLQGWTGPLAQGTEPYKYEQAFPIQLITPYYVVNPNEVIVVTANHPDGVIVPIHWLNSDAPPKDSKSTEASDLPPLAIGIPEPPKDIWVLEGENFEIPNLHPVSKDVRMSVVYEPYDDKGYVDMVNAGILQGILTWTFKARKLGTTEIKVFNVVIPPSPTTPIVQQLVTTYTVHIILLDVASLKLYPGLNEVESWEANVNAAIKNVVEPKYPDAKLYEVNSSLPTSSSAPTTNPNKLTKIRLVFQNKDNTTVTIESKDLWGEWNDPVLIDQPWLEDIVVPWPPKFDIVTAVSTLQEAGHKDPFYTCTLRHLLHAETLPDQPYYIFGTADGYYFVGYDGKVYPVINVGLKLQIGGNKEITAGN
jgi:hypothetical protein